MRSQLLYARVRAGNAAWRAEVVPKMPNSDEAKQEARSRQVSRRWGATKGRTMPATPKPGQTHGTPDGAKNQAGGR